jgi:hypothetical protein
VYEGVEDEPMNIDSHIQAGHEPTQPFFDSRLDSDLHAYPSRLQCAS